MLQPEGCFPHRLLTERAMLDSLELGVIPVTYYGDTSSYPIVYRDDSLALAVGGVGRRAMVEDQV